MSPNECEKELFKKEYFRAVYRGCAYWHLFFFYQSITLPSSTINTIANKMPGPFAPPLWIVCTNTPSSEQKKSEIRPIRPIPNVHGHTIGIVFTIGIEYCFDDMWIRRLRLNGAQLNDWIYWWRIDFIQSNFSIARRRKKVGCQRVYDLGLDQLWGEPSICRSPVKIFDQTTRKKSDICLCQREVLFYTHSITKKSLQKTAGRYIQ